MKGWQSRKPAAFDGVNGWGMASPAARKPNPRLFSSWMLSGPSSPGFLIETRKRQPGAKRRVVCIEVKHAPHWKRQWERAMRDMAASGDIEVERQFGVYRGTRR